MSSGVSECKYCAQLTLHSLCNGYLHATTRASLVRTAQTCRFCSLLFRKDRSRHGGQLLLKLAPFSDDDGQLCLSISHVQQEQGHGKAKNGTAGTAMETVAFLVYTLLGI